MRLSRLSVRAIVPVLGIAMTLLIAEQVSAGVIFGFDTRLSSKFFGGRRSDDSRSSPRDSDAKGSTPGYGSTWWVAFADWFKPLSERWGKQSSGGESNGTSDGGYGSGGGSNQSGHKDGSDGGTDSTSPHDHDVGSLPLDWLNDPPASPPGSHGGSGGSSSPPVVPEPASAGLLGLGLAGWWLRRKWRASRAV